MSKYLVLFLTLFFLTACQSYKVEVDLTPERQAELQKIIQDSQVAINNYQGEPGTIAHLNIIDQAEAYHEWGDLGKAMEIYEKTIQDNHEVVAIMNNLGRLYEETNQHKKAAGLYETLYTKYGEKRYLYDLTSVYLTMGDVEKAQKYYGLWKVEYKKNDPQFEQRIRELRDK